MESKISVNKRPKNQDRSELENLSKPELIDKIIQLQAHNFQLKNLLQKKLDGQSIAADGEVSGLQEESPAEGQNKKNRKFDFKKCHKRHVLLKFLYLGWDYQGLACQEDTHATIEYHMFKALTRTCLIESRQTSNYHRCGRTDKEVSAFCQVISIDLRSKFPEEEQLSEEAIKNEIDYCGLLNRLLPKNIQCISWMPLSNRNYSARFDCKKRTYRYYFPSGELNIEAMRKGCELLVNSEATDFRNLCKMDVHNGVMNYKRKIYSAEIKECLNQGDSEGYSMYYLEIQANSFLWHQIRCIMAVLLLIGSGKEEPDVILDLLNIDVNPCKPQYAPAAAFPLNLYNCEFRPTSSQKSTESSANDEQEDKESISDTTTWVFSKESMEKLIETIQGEWTQSSVKAVMTRDTLRNLEITYKHLFCGNVKAQANILQECVRVKSYQKLMTRKRCESLENRVEHFVKKQRLIVKDSTP